MQNATKKKKLQLTTETVTKLRESLTEDQLKAIIGGQDPRTQSSKTGEYC